MKGRECVVCECVCVKWVDRCVLGGGRLGGKKERSRERLGASYLLFLIDISKYRLRFGSPLLYKSVFHLKRLTAQLFYEGRAAVEGGK
jgi:hypothetical protein